MHNHSLYTNTMAWRCSGATYSELIANLKREHIITKPSVEAAMRRVLRGHYTRGGENASEDAPQHIGHRQTISAPHMHAMCLEQLAAFLQPGHHALDCGSGSGYLTACMAHMVGPTGKVCGIEYVPELVPFSLQNLKDDGWGDALAAKTLQIRSGDASLGWDGTSRFDAIHVGAAAPAIPQPLVDALNSPGKMIIPVGVEEQKLLAVEKSATGHVSITNISGVCFVPFHMEDTPAYHP